MIAALGAGCTVEDDASEESGGASGSGGSSGSGAGSSGKGAAGSGTGGTGATGGSANRGWVGNFQVTIADTDAEGVTPAHSSVFGVVYDRPTPIEGVRFEESEREGDCRLLVPVNPLCDPDCDIDSVCTANGVCTPYSTPQNLGVISMTGLLPGDFSMDPIAPSYKYQPPGSVHLAYPPCAEGAPVALAAASAGLALETTCVAPLVLNGAGTIPVRANEPVALTWEAPGRSGTRVGIDLDIAHHGGATGKIVCDVADTGSFEIPEGLVTRLVSLGLAGFPAITLTRNLSVQSSSEPGIELTITASTSRLVDTGVLSCGSGTPCPDDLSCQTDHTCK